MMITTTYPAAEAFGRRVPLLAVAVVDPVARELYGVTTLVLDPVRVHRQMLDAGLLATPAERDVAAAIVEQRLQNLV